MSSLQQFLYNIYPFYTIMEETFINTKMVSSEGNWKILMSWKICQTATVSQLQAAIIEKGWGTGMGRPGLHYNLGEGTGKPPQLPPPPGPFNSPLMDKIFGCCFWAGDNSAITIWSQRDVFSGSFCQSFTKPTKPYIHRQTNT